VKYTGSDDYVMVGSKMDTVKNTLQAKQKSVPTATICYHKVIEEPSNMDKSFGNFGLEVTAKVSVSGEISRQRQQRR